MQGIFNTRELTVNKKDLVRQSLENPALNPLAVLHRNNRLCMINGLGLILKLFYIKTLVKTSLEDPLSKKVNNMT